MKLYKLTDENMKTNGGEYQWSIGKHSIDAGLRNPELCTNGVFHCYTDVNLGLLINPRHNNFGDPRLFECEGIPIVRDWNKAGAYELEVIRELELPGWYINNKHRVCTQFAVLCAEEALHIWEERHPGDKRPKKAIQAAKKWLENPTAFYAAYAANAAAYATDAAYAAADAAYAANAAAYAAAYAANAAANAANAAYAAADAAHALSYFGVDFIALANKAIEMEEK